MAASDANMVKVVGADPDAAIPLRLAEGAPGLPAPSLRRATLQDGGHLAACFRPHPRPESAE
jgi:hypothetical protein